MSGVNEIVTPRAKDAATCSGGSSRPSISMKRARKPFLTVKVVPACVRESSLAAGRRDPHGSRVVPVVHDADRTHREAGGETLRESALPPRDREEKAVVLSAEEGEAHR